MARSVTSAFIAFSLILFIAGVRTQEVEDESEFEYKEGPKGPEHWGELKEEWKTCGNGTHQSPIDVVKRNAIIYPDLGRLRKIYHPANATLMNRGHDIMVNWSEGAGGVEIEGKRFTLNQCHWHTPAEHTVDGKRHPLEIHLVHQAVDGKIAVIAIIYKFGRPDTFLAELMDEIMAIADMNPPKEPLGIVNPIHIKFGSRKYYRYTGSLTTPPCTEGVIWSVIHKVDLLSRVNHKKLVSLLGYCKESKELMLVYEHMSGGSLRDHLYGREGVSELNWKARLKIALDAAQGLLCCPSELGFKKVHEWMCGSISGCNNFLYHMVVYSDC